MPSFYPGRVLIDYVKIIKNGTSREITPMVVEINVETSIADTSATTDLVVVDAKNVISNLPIGSGDEIEFSISFAQKSYVYNVVVFKVMNIQTLDQQKTYTLRCFSKLSYLSLFTKVSKHYTGTTSEMAFSIFKAYAGGDSYGIWDSSIGTQSLIVPFISPIKAITWLAKRSRPVYDDVRFRFFQDSKLKYYFCPIEKFNELYKERPVVKYTYNKNTSSTNGVPNSEAVMTTILSLTYHDAYDLAVDARRGAHKSLRVQHDLNKKFFESFDYNYWRDFDKNKSPNDNPNIPFIGYDYSTVQNDFVLSNSTDIVELNKVNDKSNLKFTSLMNSQKIEIVVKGNEVLEVGQIIEVDIPSKEPKTDQIRDQKDLTWSGKYFIVAKRDMFTKEGMQTALTLSKQSQITGEYA